MAVKPAANRSQKITITLPPIIVKRLNDLVPARQRSHFIAEVLEDRLALAEQMLALEESAGVWTDEAHPELPDNDAIDQWLAALRQSWLPLPASTHGDLSA